MKYSKRDATPEEEQNQIQVLHARYHLLNKPETPVSMSEWIDENEKCKKEGYKTEVCSCGLTFLASCHFVRCEQNGCPMRSEGGKSLLDMMLGD